jgi:hypothetical protein
MAGSRCVRVCGQHPPLTAMQSATVPTAPHSSTALLQPRSCAAVPAHLLSPDLQLQQYVQVSISPQPSGTPDNSLVLVQLCPSPLGAAAMHTDSPTPISAATLLERGESGNTEAPTLALQLQQSDGSPTALRMLDHDSSSLSTSPARTACASFRSIASAPDRLQLTQGAFLSPSPDIAIAVHASCATTLHQRTLKPRRTIFPQGSAAVSGSAAASAAAAAAAAHATAVAATSAASCAQPAWQTPIDLTRHLSTLLAPVEDLFSSFSAFFTPSVASAAMSHWVAMQRVLLVHPDLQQARLLERQRRLATAHGDPPCPYTPIPAMLFGGALSANSSLLALLIADVAEQRAASSCEPHQQRLRALADLRRRLLDLERDPLCGAVKPHLLEQQEAIALEYSQLSVQATICRPTLPSSATHLCSSVRRVWCTLQRQGFFDAAHGRQRVAHV